MNKRERTPYATDTVPITLRLDPALHELLKKQAQKEQRSLNSQIAIMLQRGMDEITARDKLES